MKRFLTVLLAFSLLLALYVPADAAHVSGDEAIGTLETLGLVKGTGNGFEGERQATRAEGLVMLLRFLGKETDVLRSNYACGFTDAGWASKYIAYAAEKGLVKGYSETTFGTNDAIDVRDYLTMMLRALGYSDAEGDFTWQGSIAFADKVGLTHGEYSTNSKFLREDMALVSYTALTMQCKDSAQRMVEKLYLDGAISAGALKATRLADVVDCDKKVYSSAEIYERTSSAVLFIETYETKEQYDKGTAVSTGSAFFVTADGVAVLSYHELNGKAYARATTVDGKTYDVIGLLHYDIGNDMAVVRVSRTDTKGNTVRFFPYLDLGDANAIVVGERIYNVSSPNGLQDSFAGGFVSNNSRTVGGLDEPCVQISIPVSQGSSGSPVVNEQGEVIAVIYGGYTNGQLLNLAIPVSRLENVRFTGNGTSLKAHCDMMNAKKAAATIKADQTSLTVKVGEEKKVVIENNYPGQADLQYEIEDHGIVSCAWGEFETSNKVSLYITGQEEGTTYVKVTFAEEGANVNAEVRIRVNVVE